MREETGAERVSAFLRISRAACWNTYRVGEMGCRGGNPHVAVWLLGILGNPLNERQASMIGQFFF